jgi:hypothetical protein
MYTLQIHSTPQLAAIAIPDVRSSSASTSVHGVDMPEEVAEVGCIIGAGGTSGSSSSGSGAEAPTGQVWSRSHAECIILI